MAKLQVQRTFVYPYPYPHLWAKYCLRFSEATNNFLKNLSFFFQLFGDLTFSKQIFCLEKSIVNWHFSCSSVSKWLTFSEIFASSVNESVCNDLMGINKRKREGHLGAWNQFIPTHLLQMDNDGFVARAKQSCDAIVCCAIPLLLLLFVRACR